MNEPTKYALIVAGGLGTRMGNLVPKQFLLLAGKPVLMHSIRAFRRFEAGIPVTVVLPLEHISYWRKLCTEHGFEEAHEVVAGGATRFESVQNGMRGLEGDGLVAIHDGVRPLIEPDTIKRLFEEAAIHSSAIPVLSPKDSLRWQDENGSHVIDRTFVKIIQTPQVFELNKLRQAYVQSYDRSFTDDATVWEKAGNTPYLAAGQETNIKITVVEDLRYAAGIIDSLRPLNGLPAVG
ncbi:MAG: 2-C-methyl-D-erythritol 4-phosphate cytidylyltransferase [Bacteroidetes bacterium GWF2_49_14]|nr:MAG: 2-C-methyl-D-erythritol 4-phosphate cytidylyltransferase [Bacteroidetes bacterium GWF2_49_14]